MADSSYKLNGGIDMQNVSPGGFQQFIPPIVDAVPADSMGTVQIQITGEGVSAQITGSNKTELQASATKFLTEMAARPTAGQQSAPTYEMQATLSLIHLSYAEGWGVVTAAGNNMPANTLVQMKMEVDAE